jgi:hypothetical protein
MKFFEPVKNAVGAYLAVTCGTSFMGANIGVLKAADYALSNIIPANSNLRTRDGVRKARTIPGQYVENTNDAVYGVAKFLYIILETGLQGATYGSLPVTYPLFYLYDYTYSASALNSEPLADEGSDLNNEQQQVCP